MFQRSALILLAASAMMSTTTARAASLQTISPSQCVWHAGDNPAWAAPGLDESGWQPLNSWKVTVGQTSTWVRCHADLSALRQASRPALQVNFYGAYQLFLNGKLVGQIGNLGNGQASVNDDQIISVAANDTAAATHTVALRLKLRTVVDAPSVTAGEADWLHALHNSESFAGAKIFLPAAVAFGVVSVLGFVLLALYLNDRSHLELLLLAIACWGPSLLRLVNLIDAAMVPIPDWLNGCAFALGAAPIMIELWFMFRLAGRKVPLLYKLAVTAFAIALITRQLAFAFFPANASLLADIAFIKFNLPHRACGFIAATAPFAAFWPWNRIPRHMRAMAGCAMFWGLMEVLWFLGSGVYRWRPFLLELRAFGTIAAIIALMALLFREYRRTAEERAILAGEMQAAQQIQRILASTTLDTATGARVEVAFRPMRDVGGDFYLCRALPDGRQRVLVGDVSGKGAAAAMTATLLIGAADRRTADSPAELLAHLNLVLHGSNVGGFATCLCADLEPGGAIRLANAGHLSPYLRGEEIALAPGLPLGLSASEGIYEELRLQLAEGDTLTFLSDGVIEARSAAGELFGFERAQAISAQPAEAIAAAAEKYGQEDDITVLTLTRTTAAAANLSRIAIPEMA